MIEQTLINKMIKLGDSDISVTYRLNKNQGIFGWYPYTEGFSRNFVDNMINNFNIKEGDTVLDPFGGCGTTMLGCALRNINSISVEVNPFMDFVLRSKYESLRLKPKEILEGLIKIKSNLLKSKRPENIPNFLKNKKFFNLHNLNEAILIKETINRLDCSDKLKRFYLLHLTSILVGISNMVRATDLKYKDSPQNDLNVKEIYFLKVLNAIEDLKKLEPQRIGNALFIKGDIGSVHNKTRTLFNKVDYFITSPPYLNGTNYERNTKLEMGFLDMIKDEGDLKEIRKNMITAGINSTQSYKSQSINLTFIQPLVHKVAEKAYDKRIPMMVRGYFNDMDKAIKNIHHFLRKDGKGVLVIGDSQFGGVHIPTDLILAKLCKLNGLRIEKMQSVRGRRSRNGMKLRESLIFVKK